MGVVEANSESVGFRAETIPKILEQCAGVTRLLDRVERENTPAAYNALVSLFEREVLTQALQRAHGNQSRIAQSMGISHPCRRISWPIFASLGESASRFARGAPFVAALAL